MGENSIIGENFTLDFELNCDNKTFTKNWAILLTSTIKECFEKVTLSINTMNTNISQRFDDLEKKLRDDIVIAATTAEKAYTMATANKSALEELQAEMQDLKLWCSELKSENSSLKKQANDIELYSRRDNILFYGIKEHNNESSTLCEKAVRTFLVEKLFLSEEQSRSIPFVRCHRLHQNNKSHVAPIIVRFKNYYDRELVWSKKSSITNKEFNMGEDFPKDVAYNRRKLLPVFGKARRLPTIDRKRVQLKSDTLFIMGKKYDVNTLDQLGGELSMRTFNERSNENLVVLGGIYSNFHPLSNYYMCPVVYRNRKYRSAYQHLKSLLHGDHITATKILAARDPAEGKRLSFDIKTNRETWLRWNAERHNLMTEILTAKFSQNPKLAEELLATGTKRIAESGKHDY